MRPLVFLLFGLGSVSAFGQSARKLNEQLWAELAAAEQKQDSAYDVFKQSSRKYDSIRKLMIEKIITISGEEQEVRNLWKDFLEADNQLKDLNISSTFLINDYPQKNDGFPDHRDVIEPLKEALDKDHKFDKVVSSFYYDKDLKPKELSPILNEKLREYQDHSSRNEVQLDILQRKTKQLTAFSPKLDSLSRVYRLLANEVRIKGGKLHNKLDELRSNYIAKGPKGFPEAYKKVFPDAFPTPPSEMKEAAATNSYSEDIEFSGTIEAAPVEPEPEIYEYADELAVFPGGVSEMRAFISKNLRYPEKVKEGSLDGRMMLRFIVSERGEISDIQVYKPFPDCKECDQEAVRMVKLMPDWVPARMNGKAVKSYVKINVWFKSE